MCVHGWGGSFATTWERNGFTALLADAGRPVIGVDLPRPWRSPKTARARGVCRSHDPRVDALPDDGTAIDAVGFSMGALTLLRTATEHPGALRRLVLAGIGKNVFERDNDRTGRSLQQSMATVTQKTTFLASSLSTQVRQAMTRPSCLRY